MPEGRITRQRAAAAKKTLDNDCPPNEPARKSTGRPTKKSNKEDSTKKSIATSKRVSTKDSTKTATTSGSRASTSASNGSLTNTPKRYKKSSAANDMEEALAALKKAEEDANKIRIEDIRELKKEFTKAIDQAKRDAQEQELRESVKKPAKSTRSGLKRGALKKIEEYTQGKIILNGMRDAKNKSPFAEDEMEYLRREVPRVKQVKDLKYEYLQYLVSYKFLPELRGVQSGEIKSAFHDRYNELIGRSKNELYSEMRLTLFTNEQRDYLNGFLQELFEANKKDERGDINHTLINYVELVMLYELTWRIVKYVHKFNTQEETLEFMKKKSREAYGISDDEE